MDIAAARYVSFVTYKRSGDAVGAPVWIAPLPDGRAGFTTDATSWKVKRLRNNPAVALRACDVRGKVADGAETVSGTAVVVADGPDRDAVHVALTKKYGIQYRLLELGGKAKRLFGSNEPPSTVVITLDTAAT